MGGGGNHLHSLSTEHFVGGWVGMAVGISLRQDLTPPVGVIVQ